MKDLYIRVGLVDHPKLAAALGDLNVAWSALELRLYGIFELLGGTSVPIARGIFYSLRTTRAKIELLQAVAPIVLRRRRYRGKHKVGAVGAPLVVLKRLSKLLGEVGRLAGERNKFVHDAWGSYDSRRLFQLRLNGKDIDGRYEAVTIREVTKLVAKIETKNESLRRLYLFLEPIVVPLHGILESQHELTLVYAKTAIRPKKKKARHQSRLRP